MLGVALSVLAWLRTPTGRAIGAVLGVALLVGGIWLHGRASGRAACQAEWDAANRAAALAAQRRDEREAVNVTKDSDADLAQIRKELADVSSERDRLARMQPTPPPKCQPGGGVLSPAFRDSLRAGGRPAARR